MIIKGEETYSLSIAIREMDVQWSSFVVFHVIQRFCHKASLHGIYMCVCVCVLMVFSEFVKEYP
jgi:hypothetical protein